MRGGLGWGLAVVVVEGGREGSREELNLEWQTLMVIRHRQKW